jgi:hypothetical protein
MTESLCPLRRYKGDTLKVTDADMFLECLKGRCAWYYDGECAVERIASIAEDITRISVMLEDEKIIKAISSVSSSLKSIADDVTTIMVKYEHSDDVYEE